MERLKMNELDEMIDHMDKRPFKAGEVIVKQGVRRDAFYILSSGKVGIYKNHLFSMERLHILGPGSYFGEMALLDNVLGRYTIKGEENGELYFLPRETFRSVLLNNPGVAHLIRHTAATRQAQNVPAKVR